MTLMSLKCARLACVVGFLGATALSLQGCVALVAGGAAMGTMSAADRRTLGTQTEDKAIVVKGQALMQSRSAQSHVNVASFNRKILLTGEVLDAYAKDRLTQAAGTIEGVRSVMNELAVLGPSSYTSRSSDSLITSKVVSRLVVARGLDINLVKVVTERGNVYLMGLVTRQEGALAVESARSVSGVQSVVKAFDYTD